MPPYFSFIGDFTISGLNFRSLVYLVCFNRFRVYFYAWCRINIQYNSFAHISMFSRTICWIDYLYYAALALLWKTFRLYLCAFISGFTIHFQIGALPLHASFMLFYFHLWSILVAESVRSLALLCFFQYCLTIGCCSMSFIDFRILSVFIEKCQYFKMKIAPNLLIALCNMDILTLSFPI